MEHINIIGTLFDNSIDHVVAHATQVRDDDLEKDQHTINEELYGLVNSTLSTINISQLQEDVEDIKNAINDINDELGNQDHTYLIFLTQEQYDALEEYEEDAVYFILRINWKFDGEFPVTLT